MVMIMVIIIVGRQGMRRGSQGGDGLKKEMAAPGIQKMRIRSWLGTIMTVIIKRGFNRNGIEEGKGNGVGGVGGHYDAGT